MTVNNAYYKDVRRILLIILFLNLFVSFIKIIYGNYANILSITTDGYHSLFDGISNVVGIIGITFAGKHPDKSHPYGYSKIETLSSICIAIMLFILGFEVITAAIGRFNGTTVPNVSIESFIIMIITILINIGVSKYEFKKGQELKSDLLISDSKHTKSDIYSSLAIIVGLVLMKLGFTILDPIISLLIAVIILKTGLEIMFKNVNFLMDKNIILQDDIENCIEDINGIIDIHNIRTRGTPSNVLIDMHMVVEDSMTIKEAHDISHKCEHRLCVKYTNIKDVTIHIEPKKGIEDKINYN